MYHTPQLAPTDPNIPLTPSEIIDKAIAKLQLTMIEIEDSSQCLYLLKFQLFYDIYDILIYLSLSSFLGYLWSMGYYCYDPEVQISCWVVILILFLIVFSLQALVNIVYLTGFDRKESKIALLTSTVVFIISFLLFWIDCSYVDKQTVQAIAIHTNALLMQIDRNIHGIPFQILQPIVYIALSILLALIALGLVIPAIRFSSLFLTITSGPGASLLSWKMKTLLLVDIAMPLLVVIVCSSLPSFIYETIATVNHIQHAFSTHYQTVLSAAAIDAMGSSSNNIFNTVSTSESHTCSGSSDTMTDINGVCVATTYTDNPSRRFFTQSLFITQCVVVVLMVVVRLLCMKKHLQCHLDSLVNAVSAQIINPNVSEDSIALLQQKVKVSFIPLYYILISYLIYIYYV